MRFIIGARGEVRLVGGDQRQTRIIGHVDEMGLNRALFIRVMALQFDIEPIADDGGADAVGGGEHDARRDEALS